VLTDPEVRDLSADEQTYWIDPDLKAAAPRVRVRYVIKPSEPLWLEDAPARSVIRQLPVPRAQGGTAHHVARDQWEQLVALAGGWPPLDAGEHDRAPYRGRRTVGFDFQKLWDYRNVLRDEGLSYQDFLEQLTFLLFLKMARRRPVRPDHLRQAAGRLRPPASTSSPRKHGWPPDALWPAMQPVPG
jgi:hypothetical protein